MIDVAVVQQTGHHGRAVVNSWKKKQTEKLLVVATDIIIASSLPVMSIAKISGGIMDGSAK